MMNDDLYQQDKAARAHALDESKSFIVQAPAGSGKTELLIQRYLKLLSVVNKPEEILAITFTKKAAHEMRARVIKALKSAYEEPEPTSAHAKQTWQLAKNALKMDKRFQWNLLHNPNQMRIQTIDSLCSYLTKQLPLLSHFGSQPEIIEKPIVLYQQAVREVLSHLEEKFEWSDAIAVLLKHLDNDMEKLYKLLVKLLSKRDQWLPYIHYQLTKDEIRVELEASLKCIINETLENIAHKFDLKVKLELVDLLKFTASHSTLRAHQQFIELDDLPPCDADYLEQWHIIPHFLLTKSNNEFSWRKKPMPAVGFPNLKDIKNKDAELLHREIRNRYQSLLEGLADNNDLRDSLIAVASLPSPHYTAEQWEALHALLIALKITAAQLRVTFQQTGCIDFIENAQGALAALGSHDLPTDLALILDYQLKHILVDEFQDTSTNQYSLLAKLTADWQNKDGRTLFVVGDPMQSIYRFREAEVGLFIRMWQQGLGQITLHPINLSVNFRSTPSIVEWNNSHFASIFPAKSEIQSGAVSYCHSVAHTATDNDAHCVAIAGFLSAHDEDQAHKLVNDIRDLQTRFPKDKIAILVRSRSHLRQLLPKLKNAKLTYRAVDISPLANRQVIIDLLSLTCALLHLGDRISWLAILRAPWCGIELNDLHRLVNKYPHKTIYELLKNKEIIAELSPDAAHRIKRIVEVLNTQIANRHRSNLRTWVESTWQQLGGPATLTNQADLDDADAFFEIVDKYTDSHIDELKAKIADHYASSNNESDLLQIMTIHSAKGLEFDTVIIPYLEKRPAKNDKQLLQWIDQPLQRSTTFILAPIAKTGDSNDMIYDYIAKQQQTKTRLEIDRLFYVATTRAKKRLCMYFNTTLKSDSSYNAPSGSFLQKLLPIISHDIQGKMIDCSQRESNESAMATTILARLPLNWKNPIHKEIERTSIHQKHSGIYLRDNSAKIIGTISHRIFEQLAKAGLPWWEKQSDAYKTDYILRHLKQTGVTPDYIDQALARILRVIKNILLDKSGRWILENHRDARSEFQITSIVDSKPKFLVIDRTFIHEQARWIVDYKTAINNHDELEDFLAAEEKKYRSQMAAYTHAFQQMESLPIRVGLYFPTLPAWRELS